MALIKRTHHKPPEQTHIFLTLLCVCVALGRGVAHVNCFTESQSVSKHVEEMPSFHGLVVSSLENITHRVKIMVLIVLLVQQNILHIKKALFGS